MVQRRNINRGYRKLEVWQKAISLFVHVNGFCREHPGVDFRLRSQILNAAQSVSANIAEGYCRKGLNEYRQFLYIALGSLGELLTRFVGLHAAGLITDERFDAFDALHYHVENMILRLIHSLQEMKKAGSWNDVIRESLQPYIIQSSIHPLIHSSKPR